MAESRDLFYYPVRNGVAAVRNGCSCLYHGKVFRLAINDAPIEKMITFEEKISNYISNLKRKNGFEPSSPVERYDTIDENGKSMIVLLRVPYVHAFGDLND